MLYLSKLYSYDQLVEREYMDGLLAALADFMEASFARFDIVVFSGGGDLAELREVLMGLSRPIVLFYLSDETGSVPTDIAGMCTSIFKCYLSQECDLLHLHALPLGCAAGLPQLPVIPVADRPINVGFSGCLQPNRTRFFTALREMAWHRGYPAAETSLMNSFAVQSSKQDLSGAFAASFIVQTAGFRAGLSSCEYARMLHSSKVALCPGGWKSNETFRLFEAMRAGCVIVTSVLPDVRLYRDAPLIQVSDWTKLESCVDDLIETPSRLAELQDATCAWWRDVCSEQAYAAYIAAILESQS